MNKHIVLKAITLVITFLVMITNAFAAGTEKNVISKIIVEPALNNTVTLNLLFDKDFKGNAFLQKRDMGSYYVFLPDTVSKGKHPQVIFKDNKDREGINIDSVEKPFIKEDVKSNYVRVSVDMADDYSIKLISGLESDYNTFLIFMKNLDYPTIAIAAISLIVLMLILNAIRETKQAAKNRRTNTRYPASFLNSPSTYLKRTEREVQPQIQRPILPKKNIRNTIKPAERNSFDCFELPFAEDMKSASEYEFKSTLNQASKMLKEKPSLSRLRHTNPINKKSKSSSELSMPAIEDVLNIPVREKKIEQKPEAELLSVLNITPSKGFYLTTVDDTMALFGFINDNVFLLKKFKDLSQINLQARYYDRNGDNDIYIVRLDSYRAMIEISEDSMKELAKI